MKIGPVGLISLILSLLSGVSPVAAQDCDLALVLALDVSKSMDGREFTLQFEGTAAALRDADVRSAILAPERHVAITAFEWSGQSHQARIADWTLLQSDDDIEAFAHSLETHVRGGRGMRTGTGSAVEFAHELLGAGPVCARSVIDVSSDGYSNDGMAPRDFYSSTPTGDVTVNALVVGGKARAILWDYFRTDVIHGPAAFAMATYGFEDYAEAIREKLLREVGPPALLAANTD